MGVLGYLLQCDMLLHAKSVSIREKTFFYPETSLFCKKACRFRDFCLSLQRLKTMVIHSGGRTSDAQQIKPGIFFAIQSSYS